MSDVEHPPQCIECGESGKETVQHHVSYEDDETVPVCRTCHPRIHANSDHPLYPPDRPDITSIEVSQELADHLYQLKNRGDSYDDVIWRLLGEANENE